MPVSMCVRACVACACELCDSEQVFVGFSESTSVYMQCVSQFTLLQCCAHHFHT